MKQLRGPFADDVHTKHLLGLAMKTYFQAPCGVASDLATRDLAIIRHAHFVRHVIVGKLFFGFPDERNFRDGIDSVWITGRVRDQLLAESSSRGDAALFH